MLVPRNSSVILPTELSCGFNLKLFRPNGTMEMKTLKLELQSPAHKAICINPLTAVLENAYFSSSATQYSL